MRITIGFVLFNGCSPAMFERAWYTLSRQDFTDVEDVQLLVNGGEGVFTEHRVKRVLRQHPLPVPTRVSHAKSNPKHTHAWSANRVCRDMARHSEWIFFTRADYLLNFECLSHWRQTARKVKEDYGPDLPLLVTSHCSLLEYRHSERPEWTPSDYDAIEPEWREVGPVALMGSVPTYTFTGTNLDAGVWLCERRWLKQGGWWNEKMVSWGFQQSEFQHRLRINHNVQHLVAQGFMFHHQEHRVDRDFAKARDELSAATGLIVSQDAPLPLWTSKPVTVHNSSLGRRSMSRRTGR